MRRAVLGVLAAATLAAGPALAAEPDAGHDLYLAQCGKCHLDGGTGAFMLSRRLGKDRALLADRSDLDPAYVRRVVRHGVGAMPWFTRVELPDSQLDAIIAYLTRAH